MRNKKWFMLITLVLVFSMLLSACGQKATPTTAPTKAPVATKAAAPTKAAEKPAPTKAAAVTKPVKLTVWDQEADDVEAFMDDLLAQFQKDHPNITIERTHYGNEELRDQFQTASLAGQAPDLVRVPNDFAGPFSELQIVIPATKVYDQAFLNAFFPGALSPAQVKGTLWGVPDNYGNHLMLLYNKDMVKTPPKDTDELIKMAKALKKGDTWGFVYNENEPFWLAPWLGGFGGWPLNDATDMPTLGTDAMAKALQFVQDLKFKDKVIPPEADYNTADTMFKEGKAAMIINGDWSLGGYAKALGDKLGVAPIPKVSSTGLWPSPMTSGKYWMFSTGLNGNADKLAAAKLLVSYMTSKDVQLQWLKKFKRLPSNKEAAQSELIKTDPVLKGSMEQLSHGRGMPAAPQMRCAWDAMRPNLEAVMSNSETPAAAAKAMQDDAMKCVEEAGLGVSLSKPVKLTVWDQEADDVEAFMDDLIAQFQKKHPKISIERTHYGNEELRDQFQTASLANSAPDLVRVPNDFAGPFSELKIIMPMEDVFSTGFLGQFFPGALEPTKVKGKIWGVPDNYGNHLMLLYNKDMVKTPPKNTDELIKMAKALKKGDTWGFVYNENEPFWLAPWLGGFGGWPLGSDDMPTLDSKAMVSALQFVQDLKFKDKVIPPEADYNTADTMFKEGKAAMIINGDWSLGGYAKALGDKLGVAPIPEVTSTKLWPTPMTSGKYWMFSTGLKGNADKMLAAKQFVVFMTSKDVQLQWLKKFKRLPSNKEAAQSDLIKTDPILKGSMEQLSHGRGMPAAAQMRCAWDAMRPNLEAVMSNSATPADAAKAMQADALKCVKEAGLNKPNK